MMLSTGQNGHVTEPRRMPRSDRMVGITKYYDDHAASYAATTMAIDTSRQLQRLVDLLPTGARILDAGCGSGRDLTQMARLGFKPVGVDASVGLARIARRNSGCPVHVGDLRSLAFEDASFDGVWAMASLLHLERSELPDVLSSFSHILRPGGVMFTSVKRGTGDVKDDTGRWFTLYDEDSWADHLRAAGLQVIEVIGEPASENAVGGKTGPGWISSLARR